MLPLITIATAALMLGVAVDRGFARDQAPPPRLQPRRYVLAAVAAACLTLATHK